MVTLAERGMISPPSGGGGTYGQEVAMFLLFKDEIIRNSRLSLEAMPMYDWGIVTEVLKNNKANVKLANLGSVVTCSGSNSRILKGATALVYIKPNKWSPMGGEFIILSVRQTGAYAPRNVSEYPV